MTQKIGIAEWFKIANDTDGCICPTCQTGRENLALYPDYCPHADSLIVKVADIQGNKATGKFRCSFYIPLAKEERKMTEQTHDTVNHPNHYNTGNIECIDYIQDKLTPEEFRGYIKGNVIKYLTREQHKNGNEDILKAQWYLNRLADTLPKIVNTEQEETNNEKTNNG